MILIFLIATITHPHKICAKNNSFRCQLEIINNKKKTLNTFFHNYYITPSFVSHNTIYWI